jgi:hypothetical protein
MSLEKSVLNVKKKVVKEFNSVFLPKIEVKRLNYSIHI